MHKISFTPDGLTKLQKEYDELLAKRPSYVTELSRARDMGDRSENAAYKSARIHLSTLDRRIKHLKKILDSAHVVQPTHTNHVDIGHKVVVECEGQTIQYTIVGGYESDITAGKISCHSPIGRAFLRKHKGDIIQVAVPAGVKTFTILDISLN